MWIIAKYKTKEFEFLKESFFKILGEMPEFYNPKVKYERYIKNKLKIYSICDAGDLTYPYQNIGSNTSIIREIVSGSHEISHKIKKAKKPMIIIGDSALYGKSGKYVFETLKNFLSYNNFIKKDWNALNILTQQASRVGAIDFGVYSISEAENFSFFNKLENDDFKLIYLLGADNINFDKKNKFVVYQGSHGAKTNITLLALAGIIISLNINFKASAKVCKIPNGPTTFGPFLF